VGGHSFEFTQEMTGQRSSEIVIPEDEVSLVPSENQISEPVVVPVTPFPTPQPVDPGADATDLETQKYQAALSAWEGLKAAHDADEEAKPPLVKMNVWLPVMYTHKVKMDGMELRVFHSFRGPILGALKSQDSNRAVLYSPTLLDPNIEQGRVHFLPIAFGGLDFTLYRSSCTGESAPQESVALAFADFVQANRDGNYEYRSMSAYHHIDVDYPANAEVRSVGLETVRLALFGLTPTLKSGEADQLQRARQLQQMTAMRASQQAREALSTPSADAPPSDDGAES